MELPSYFTDFVSSNTKGINLTSSQRNDCITGHTTLRERLNKYDDLKDVLALQRYLHDSSFHDFSFSVRMI